MSRSMHFPVEFQQTGYCPECRAKVEHTRHRSVPIPDSGMPPKGEYAPEHRPERNTAS